jgi:Uma2 family endonuclease
MEEVAMQTVHISTLFDTPPHARLSADDYIASPQSAHKSDLIEGVFVMASPASFEHASVQPFLITTLSNYVSARTFGIVLGENAAYRLNDDNVYQPDVSFLSNARLHLAGEVYIHGAPDLAIEVISPSSRQYDTVEKRINYGRFGVQEYWLVDPIGRTVTVYEQTQGQLVPVRSEEGLLRSKLLPGFWLQLDWIFPPTGASRPGELDVARAQGLIT